MFGKYLSIHSGYISLIARSSQRVELELVRRRCSGERRSTSSSGSIWIMSAPNTTPKRSGETSAPAMPACCDRHLGRGERQLDGRAT